VNIGAPWPDLDEAGARVLSTQTKLHQWSKADPGRRFRVVGWLRKRHVGLNMHTLVRRYLPGWELRDGDVSMFRPQAVAITRYRYRGTRIPTPWSSVSKGLPASKE